jgi:hypothetical protein
MRENSEVREGWHEEFGEMTSQGIQSRSLLSPPSPQEVLLKGRRRVVEGCWSWWKRKEEKDSQEELDPPPQGERKGMSLKERGSEN